MQELMNRLVSQKNCGKMVIFETKNMFENYFNVFLYISYYISSLTYFQQKPVNNIPDVKPLLR